MRNTLCHGMNLFLVCQFPFLLCSWNNTVQFISIFIVAKIFRKQMLHPVYRNLGLSSHPSALEIHHKLISYSLWPFRF